MSRLRRPIFRFGLPFVFVALLLAAFGDRLLFALGAWLVNAEPPQKTEMVVSIGGDFAAERIIRAAELVREGYAPKVLASGSGSIYGQHEADLQIGVAVRKGYPADEFIAFRYPALSTTDEARAIVKELRRLGIHKFTVVTTVCHTARAGRVFRREAGDLEVHMVEASNEYWDHGMWWKNREGQKLWLFEAMKTVADYLGV